MRAVPMLDYLINTGKKEPVLGALGSGTPSFGLSNVVEDTHTALLLYCGGGAESIALRPPALFLSALVTMRASTHGERFARCASYFTNCRRIRHMVTIYYELV
jgi:hypothetical protein